MAAKPAKKWIWTRQQHRRAIFPNRILASVKRVASRVFQRRRSRSPAKASVTVDGHKERPMPGEQGMGSAANPHHQIWQIKHQQPQQDPHAYQLWPTPDGNDTSFHSFRINVSDICIMPFSSNQDKNASSLLLSFAHLNRSSHLWQPRTAPVSRISFC